MDLSALRLGHNSVSVLYHRCIAVCAPSKNVPSYASDSRIHCDVPEVDVIGFFPPLTDAIARRHQDSNMPGVFRKDWETFRRSTQCLFWHFIVTYLSLYICICRDICSFFPSISATSVLSLVVVCQHIPTLATGEEQQSS